MHEEFNCAVKWNYLLRLHFFFFFLWYKDHSIFKVQLIETGPAAVTMVTSQVNTPLWPWKHTSRPLYLVPSSMEACLPWFPLRMLQRRKQEWVSVFLHQTHKPGDHVTLSSQLWFSLSSGNTGTTFTSDENDHIHELHRFGFLQLNEYDWVIFKIQTKHSLNQHLVTCLYRPITALHEPLSCEFNTTLKDMYHKCYFILCTDIFTV